MLRFVVRAANWLYSMVLHGHCSSSRGTSSNNGSSSSRSGCSVSSSNSGRITCIASNSSASSRASNNSMI